MHLQLDSRPGISDVSADGLTLQFCATPGLEVVGTLSGRLAAARLPVLVEVLAASHRVHLLGDDGVLATEQVACVAGGPVDPLPARATHPVRDRCLEFRADRPDLDAASLAELASTLRARGTDDDTLVVSFPGHPDALTTVRLVPDGWETWHLYPGDRPHAVRTRTTVAAR